MASVVDILLFHKVDRTLFEMILSMGRPPVMGRNIVALWIWLEFVGGDLIKHLKDCSTPSALLEYVQEAEAILEVIRQDNPPPADDSSALPITAPLFRAPLDLRFFYYHSEAVARGITGVLDGIGRFIFDYRLYQLLDSYETALGLAQEQRGSTPVMPEELARPYNPRATAVVPEEHRSLFITFSKGFLLSREEIAEYFNQKWGNCVERVMLERTAVGVQPMYGRVVFASGSLIDVLLNGMRMVKFIIKGAPILGRKYVPGSHRLLRSS